MAGLTSLLCVLCVAAPALAVRAPTFKLYDGKEIPAFGLGTWLGLTPDKNQVKPLGYEVTNAVQWALEAGYRHVDTAPVYGIEDQVGRALAAKIADGTVKREELFITTKLWNDKHARDAVVPALRESLAKLQLEYVDLYLIHYPTGSYPNGTFDETPLLETWKGMEEAKRLGLAKSIGVSNFNAAQIQGLIKDGDEKPAVLQVELNLNLQQPELLSYCKTQDIVVMAYTPFGSLFPQKAAADAPEPRESDPDLMAIADRHDKTVTQVTLRYIYELGAIPIPKSLTKSRIEENIDIFDFQLSDSDKQLLRSFDKHYRTLPQLEWSAHPYYPFEKPKV